LKVTGPAERLALELIRHRGPDSAGEWTSPDGRCWLGNRRLAIVDLSPTGAQPMTDPASGNVIVTNGEIYNHRAVREKLGANVEWRGTSDTETLLLGYARWGQGVLEHLKGMFAFAIYDAARNELFLARDRLGIKPLYYIVDANGLRAASEVRVLAPASAAIKPEAVSAYLQWGACPEGELIYSGIQALPAGHAMTVGSDGEIKTWRYWPARKTFALFPEDVIGRVRGLLDNAVEEHLLSDVPVASFLSGGIDSSVVTALAAQKLANKLQTYSVGFDLDELDETAISQEIADRYKTDHHRIQLSEEEVIASVTEAVEKLDLPSVDALNTYIVSRAVAAHGVKVALSGLGGDELFGGYPSFRDVPRLQLIARLPSFLRTDESIRRAGLPITTEPKDAPVDLPDDFARISWAELTGYMRRMLLRDADQMSMAVSLEMRVPFLDHQLVEYVLGLPAAAKKRYPGVKGLLVEACRDLLPASVYDRPKAGFVLPMRQWMRGPLAAFVKEGLDETVGRGLLPEVFVSELRETFQRERLHWTRLWSLVVLGHYAKRRQLVCSPNENSPIHPHR